MRFTRKDDIEAADLEDQTILFNPENNTFCVLNETAARIWSLLEESTTADELTSRLAEAFEVGDQDEVRRDVQAALEELTELDLVTPST